MQKVLFLCAIVSSCFGNLFAQGHPCNLSQYYEFKGHYQTKTTIYQLGKDSMVLLGDNWINDSAKLVCMVIHSDQPEMTISTIMNTKDSSSVVLMDMGPNGKNAMCFTAAEGKQLAAKNPVSSLIESISGIKATGRTKTIGDKLCQEYRSDSTDYSIVVWCCDAIKGLNAPGAVPQIPGIADPGLMLEFSLIDKKQHAISHTITTLFDARATRSISTDGY